MSEAAQENAARLAREQAARQAAEMAQIEQVREQARREQAEAQRIAQEKTKAIAAATVQVEAKQAEREGAVQETALNEYLATLTPVQKEALFTATTTFNVDYTENGEKKTDTFKNLGDAQRFADLQAQKNAVLAVKYVEGGQDKMATFRTGDQASQFVERLTGTSDVVARQALESQYIHGAKRQGIFDISDIIRGIEETGAKMQTKAIEAKMKGRDIEAGLLTTTGALYRFGWGIVAWPVYLPGTLITAATKPGAIVEAAVADPVVTAMNLAFLGYSATQIAKRLNEKFGITNKAYAAKLADSAFEIVTKEDKMFYYPPETQASGYEMFDFESYKPMKRAYIANFDAGGSLDLDMSDWNAIAFKRDVTPDVYINAETWTPNLITHAAGPTVMSLQFDAKGNPYIDFGAMKNSQVNSLIAMKEYYDVQLGIKNLGETMTETVLKVAQEGGTARPTYALINYTPTGVTVTSEVGVLFIPLIEVKQRYQGTEMIKLSDAQIIAAIPILMNLIVDPKIRTKQIERLNDKTINAILDAMNTKSIHTTITGLDLNILYKLTTRLDQEQAQKLVQSLDTAQLQTLIQDSSTEQNQELVQSLTTTQVQELIQNLNTTQIQELAPVLVTSLTTTQLTELSKKLPPVKRGILLAAMEKRRLKPPAGEEAFTVKFVDLGGKIEVINVRSRTFRQAYISAFNLRRWHGRPHSVDIIKL